MLRLYVRRAVFAVLPFLAVFSFSIEMQAAKGCGWRCNNAYSGTFAECVSTRVLGQANCRVVENCNLIVVDPDGPSGPRSPELQWVCSYDCAFDTCRWV